MSDQRLLPLLTGLMAGASLHASKGVVRKLVSTTYFVGLNIHSNTINRSNIPDTFFNLAYKDVSQASYIEKLNAYLSMKEPDIIKAIDRLKTTWRDAYSKPNYKPTYDFYIQNNDSNIDVMS